MARGRKRSPLRALAVLLLMAVVAMCVLYGVSAHNLNEEFKEAESAYAEFEEQMDDLSYHEALDAVRRLSTAAEHIEYELHAWQWEMASRMPVLGQDVRTCQEAAEIANDLANEALYPVAAVAESLLGDSEGQDIVSVLQEKAGQVSELAEAVSHGRSVIEDCERRAQELPSTHFEKLDEKLAKVRKAAADAAKALDDFEPLLLLVDAAGGIADLIS